MVRRRKILFPFDEVAAELGRPFTESSILQHLRKMKDNQVATPAKSQGLIVKERSSTNSRNDDEQSAEQGVPAGRVQNNNMKRSARPGIVTAGRLIQLKQVG